MTLGNTSYHRMFSIEKKRKYNHMTLGNTSYHRMFSNRKKKEIQPYDTWKYFIP